MNLKEYKEKHLHTNKTLARKLRCSECYLSSILTGGRLPGVNLRRRIAKLLSQEK